MEVGTYVDVPGRKLTHYGKITELLPNNEARVRMKTTGRPQKQGVCDKCGCPGMLSMNGGTGELVCMSSGCGHGHGFDERDEILSLEILIDVEKAKLPARKEAFRHELDALLARGVTNKVITAQQQAAILNLI